MQFLITITITLLATLVYAAVLPKRQTTTVWQSPYNGTIVAPASGDVIVTDTDFPFEYTVSNWCQSSFSPFIVYLTAGAEPPLFDAVTENGTLAEGTYLLNFGRFMASNFGQPVPGFPPPPTLNLPPMVAENLASQAYLSVVQEFDGCPGHIAVEFSLTSVALTVNVAE